ALDRSLISQLPLFQGMTAEEQSEILRSARSSRYAKESAIFEQETEAHSFFVLISGHIRVVRTTPDGQQVIARYIS
ncbi:MAG: cyclic nucleotide-binding domain-containing protein, partial [Mesorhizobium sp.]